MMDLDQFMDAVLVAVPKMATVFPDRDKDTFSVPSLKTVLVPLYEAGFSAADAASFCLCFDEVSPDLDEDVALRRMDALKLRYGMRSDHGTPNV
jgi:hypothetical protein